MQTIQLTWLQKTKEIVNIEHAYIGKRVLSGFVDLMIVLSPSYLFLVSSELLVINWMSFQTYRTVLELVYQGYPIVLLILYPLLSAWMKQGSIGLACMHMEVQKAQDVTLPFSQRWMRIFFGQSLPIALAGYYAGGKGILITLVLLSLSYLFTPTHISWIDIVLSTKIVPQKKETTAP